LGSGRASINAFQNDRPIAGTIHGLLALSDVFLVKSLLQGGIKLGSGLAARVFAREAAGEAGSVGARALERGVIGGAGRLAPGSATANTLKNAHPNAHGFSIRNVNPHDLSGAGGLNCVRTAIAADATLAGNAAQALPGLACKTFKEAVQLLENTYTGTVAQVASHTAIETAIKNAGAGARGIVIGYKQGAPFSHAFNVVNQKGTVQFLDAQIGAQAKNVAGYDFYWFIRTN
jgi:hypothetical protein